MKRISRVFIVCFLAGILNLRTGADQALCGEGVSLRPSKIMINDQRLNDDTGAANQFTPALAMHPQSLTVAAWPDGRNGGSDIYFQLYNRRGQPFGTLGNVKVNDASHTGSYLNCDVAMDGYGHFLVVWDGGSAGSSHVYRQWYLANGKPIGGNNQVDEAEGSLINAGAAVAGFDSGGYVVVWTDRRYDDQGDVAYQIFGRTGQQLGGNVYASPVTTSAQLNAAVDVGRDGRFLVVWQEGLTGSRIMARLFDAVGPLDPPFQVAPQSDPAALSSFAPAVACSPDGGFAVFWMADYGAGEIRRQACLYDYWGHALTGVFRVDEPGKFQYQGEVAVTSYPGGRYLFAWSGNEGGDWNIYVRACDETGTLTGASYVINDKPGRQMGPDVAVDDTGNILFTWYDNRNGDLDAYGARLSLEVPTSITAGGGFDGLVPLSWEPAFGENPRTSYTIFRGEDPEAMQLLATVDVTTRLQPERMLDFIDTTAENGRNYYYNVVPADGLHGMKFTGPVTPAAAGHALASSWSLSDPTFDGILSAGEWDDAMQVDISEPYGYGDVRLYVKNSAQALFIAAEDANDIILEPATLFGMLIDPNHDGRWPSAGPSTEGLIGFTLAGAGFQGYWGAYPDGLGGDAIKPAAGVLSAISFESVPQQYEVAIALPAAPAVPHAGQTIGFAVSVSDPGNFYGYHYGYAGEWPPGALWEAAESLGDLTLAAGPTTTEDRAVDAPGTFTLGRNYPNPFNPSTTVPFSIPNAGRVWVRVYDLRGKEIAVLADGMRAAGNHAVRFDASGLVSGVYLVRMEAGGFSLSRKIAVVK